MIPRATYRLQFNKDFGKGRAAVSGAFALLGTIILLLSLMNILWGGGAIAGGVGLREARSPNSALLPEHALFIDLLQRRRNAARCAELVDRVSARRTGIVVVDDHEAARGNLVI